MAVSRWDPFRELSSIQNELNRLFGRTFTPEGGEGTPPDVAWVPPVDIGETRDRFVLFVELPGVAGDDVDISVEDGVLTLAGRRGFYGGVKEDQFHRVERSFGTFARNISLPQTADVERISASFDQGVLTIEIPKKEEAKPRKIQVKASG